MNYSEAKMRAAIESFERALQLEPEYAMARAGLAISLAWFSVRYAYQKDALYWGRRAEEEAYRALALDHDLAEAHFAIASAAGTVYGKFNWPRLLAEVDEALKLDPALDLAYASRARAFYHLGLFEAAHEAASKAIALNPDGNVETHRLLVALSLFTSRFADAAARAEELTRQTDAPVIRMYSWRSAVLSRETEGGRGAPGQRQTRIGTRRPVPGRAGRRARRNRPEGRRGGHGRDARAKPVDGSPHRVQPRHGVRADGKAG